MAYRIVHRQTSVSAAVEDGFSGIAELAEEMREWYDNLTEGLQQTGNGQTVGETADALESHSGGDPEVPDCIADSAVTYTESVNRDKRRGPSRAVRCENACQLLGAAVESASQWLADNPPLGEGYDDEAKAKRDEDRDAVENFVSELEQVTGEVEGCEFPSMYG